MIKRIQQKQQEHQSYKNQTCENVCLRSIRSLSSLRNPDAEIEHTRKTEAIHTIAEPCAYIQIGMLCFLFR